jgi:hypothetical protein
MDGPWHIIEHTVRRKDGSGDRIGRSEWADWSHSGDLLFSMAGGLFRVKCTDGVLGPLSECEQIADFSEHSFGNLEAPDRARRWPKR